MFDDMIFFLVNIFDVLWRVSLAAIPVVLLIVFFRKSVATGKVKLAEEEARTAKNELATLRDEFEKQKRSLQDSIAKRGNECGILTQKLNVATDDHAKLKGITSSIVDKFISETTKQTINNLTTTNFATSKKRIESIYAFCEKQGFPVPKAIQDKVIDDLKTAYESLLKKEYAKQEQRRIQEQMRQEAREEAERQKELDRMQREERAIEEALQRALRKATDEHGAEIERLKEQLAAAQEKLQRAKSMAELTKAGYVYIISNIGSFGENVFKVGMTRRLEPMDRIDELSSASVPFPYDIHAMISCENAPSLENALHRAIHNSRLNRVNMRKEFFKVDLDTIIRLVEKHHGKVEYLADPAALEYRESLNMTEEDFAFVTKEIDELSTKNSSNQNSYQEAAGA